MKVRALNDADREIDLEEGIDEIVQRMEAKLNEAGFSTHEVLNALEEVVRNRRLALAEDPDPAEDP